MNETIQTLLNHRSIRDYKDQPLSDEQVRTLIECAQAAATSSFLQAYSIIGVKDKEKRQELSRIGRGQKCIVDCGHFFVFCADLYRHELAADLHDQNILESLESTETFMVGLIDTALAAQNMVAAAESMGLGICYIGGLRNNAMEVSNILELPERVIPLFGLCVGYPEKVPDQKPRLPFDHIYHVDKYEKNKKTLGEQLLSYDDTIKQYYNIRTEGARVEGWTWQMANGLNEAKRLYMKDFLKQKKFPLK